MNSLFPASTNAAYRGPAISAWFLSVLALIEIAAGAIHYFLPDGGAGSIAGIDLSTRAATIIAIFGWFGALQIPTGLLLLTISVRYRNLVPLGLMWVIMSRGLMSIDAWIDAAPNAHHPPEHFGSPIAVALSVLLLFLSLQNRRGA